MVSILDRVKCDALFLRREERRLSSEETWALVRAMETRVEEVSLGNMEKTLLDVTALIQYSGRGRCRRLYISEHSDDEEKYGEELKNWASDRQWTMREVNYCSSLILERRD